MFWFYLGHFGFPLPVMGCSARKYDALALVHGLSDWYGFVVNSSGLGVLGGSLWF